MFSNPYLIIVYQKYVPQHSVTMYVFNGIYHFQRFIFDFHRSFQKLTSQLIRYPRACGSYQDFLDRGLLLTRKLLN